MTIHQQQEQRLASLEQTDSEHLMLESKPKRLLVTNPLIYFFILIGTLVLPETLKQYRIQLNVTEKLHLQKQAARVAITLLWIPFLAIFAYIWLSGLVPVHLETAAFMFGACLFSCYSSYKYSLTKSIESKNNLLLGSMVAGFGLAAALFTGIHSGSENGNIAIFLCILILAFALISLCIAMVFKLETIDILSGFIALFIVGGISMTMSQVMTNIWMPVITILILLLGVGITEERHNVS